LPYTEAEIKNTAWLRRHILSREARVTVIGQGYVGLSLACAAAGNGFSVTGLDVDGARIEALQRGEACVPGVSPQIFGDAFATGNLSFTQDPEAIAGADIVVICVPTPVRDHGPDLTYVEQACRSASEHLKPGRLVILESTTYPGTTEQVVAGLLETSGLAVGVDILLAYSPERIDPGNTEYDFRSIPRIVGAVTPEATGVAALFYEQLVDKVEIVASCRAAELAKLLENTFRHINIALINEMAMFCHEMDIDVWEVIGAAASKPFGFMPFHPGPGVGGHCIPLDPTYLAWQVRRDSGHMFRILEQAQDVNAQMPSWVAARIGDALNDVGKPVKGANILVLGVAYKPDIGDVRESPALKVIGALKKRGARIEYHDPYVPSITVNGNTYTSVELSQRVLARSDCVALITPHQSIDLEWVAERTPLIFDARNAYNDGRHPNVIRL
jgi:UDP-N-acetyl-D-glucosamine dehydrogenase